MRKNFMDEKIIKAISEALEKYNHAEVRKLSTGEIRVYATKSIRIN